MSRGAMYYKLYNKDFSSNFFSLNKYSVAQYIHLPQCIIAFS